MNTTSSNDKNTFYKTSVVDGLETPYPPDAPAYCTRQSIKDVENTSKELTRKELDKLQKKTSPPLVTKQVTCVPSVEFNPDMHRIMCKYADKQQQLCNQICEINSRLQRKQDMIVELKENQQKQLTELQDELTHMTEVNDGNEQEIEELNEKLDMYRDRFNELQAKHKDYVDTQPLWVFLYIVLYTLCLFFSNKRYNLQLVHYYDTIDDLTGKMVYKYWH